MTAILSRTTNYPRYLESTVMSEDVTRAVGGNGAQRIVIAGVECTVRPLSLRELGEIERECLNQYRESKLEYLQRTAKYLPDGEGAKLLRDKLEEMAAWDVKNLPLMTVYDPDRLVITDALRNWVREKIGDAVSEIEAQADEKRRDRLFKQVVATSLDSGELTAVDYTRLTNKPPVSLKTGYVNWWITGCFSGMLEMAYMAFRHNGVTRDQVSEALGRNMSLMVQLSREIESLSAPQTGNI